MPIKSGRFHKDGRPGFHEVEWWGSDGLIARASAIDFVNAICLTPREHERRYGG